MSELHSDSNSSLYPGQQLRSSNGRAMLSAQEDGNVVVYATIGGDPISLWATGTGGNGYNRFTMNNNGEVCVFVNPDGGDTRWKSGSWNSGHPGPYTLRMQDDGNLVAYSSDGTAIWASGSHVSPEPIAFSQVRFLNGAHGCAITPFIADAMGKSRLWDPRADDPGYWMLADGMDKNVDLQTDTVRINGSTKYIGDQVGDGTVCVLGFDVSFGDDDWVDPLRKYQFVYRKDSATRVTIRKYGGLRNGDAAFDGAQAV